MIKKFFTCLILFFIFIFIIFIFKPYEVKALNIPKPNTFDVYNRNGTKTSTYTLIVRSNWWWSYTLYTPYNNSTGDVELNLYNTPRFDFVWSNFKQYCSDFLNIQGSFTHGANFDAIADTYDVYIINGTTSSLCSKNVDLSNHKVDFNCSTKMTNNAIAISIRYNGPNGLYGNIGLINISQFSCILDSSSIINNQNNNANNIINNQNQNKQEIINNQNQNADKVNNSINNVNDSITDINVDSSSASGFFNSFSNNDHGLSGIVSSPLRLVNAFTSNTCTPAKFSIYGKEVELPCSTYLTSRDDVKPFYIAYNVIMGGLISYGALLGIRKKVDDFKNPDDSKVEVMDL